MFPFIGQPEPLGFVSSDRQHTETLSDSLTGFQYTTIHTYQLSCFKVYTRFETIPQRHENSRMLHTLAMIPGTLAWIRKYQAKDSQTARQPEQMWVPHAWPTFFVSSLSFRFIRNGFLLHTLVSNGVLDVSVPTLPHLAYSGLLATINLHPESRLRLKTTGLLRWASVPPAF